MSRSTPKILQIQVHCIITQLTSYYALWQVQDTEQAQLTLTQ